MLVMARQGHRLMTAAALNNPVHGTGGFREESPAYLSGNIRVAGRALEIVVILKVASSRDV